MKQVTLAQFGMGPIGVESVRLAVKMPWARIVGAVDIDPDKIGRSLAELTGVAGLSNVYVHGSFADLWSDVQPEVVLHTAGSKAIQSIEQITPMVEQGVSVASTCEELFFPALRAQKAASKIDMLAQRTGARIVGTGVNPGFVMDVLPVFITGASRNVQSIAVQRVVNASTRRMPLQKKIGSGIEPEVFRKLFAQGKAGHAGFRESAALIAHCLGWKIDELTETCEPVIADHDIKTAYFEVSTGLTCGLHQRCVIKVDGQVKVDLDLKMYLDAKDPHDAVQIAGDPPMDFLAKGGVDGDIATVASLVNSVPRLLAAPAGMRLMTELPIPMWSDGFNGFAVAPKVPKPKMVVTTRRPSNVN